MIKKVVLKNFRAFRDSSIDFNPGLNILVGDNESGKSTLLEAINLGLTSRSNGRYLTLDLNPHIVNQEAREQYVNEMQAGLAPEPPEVVVELYFEQNDDTKDLKGTNNSLTEDACGVRLRVFLDPEYIAEYDEFIEDPSQVQGLPMEYFTVEWKDFAGRSLTKRAVKVSSSLIDASRIRLRSGSDYFLQQIIEQSLSDRQNAQLARNFRNQQEAFAADPAILDINTLLQTNSADITNKMLTMEANTSAGSGWETSLEPHLDQVPFHHSGNGEQNMLKILLALSRKVEDSQVILIEEPENHLSFSSLNQLISKIAEKCVGRQVVITTHSSYVINKLGLEQLMLLSDHAVTRLNNLSEETYSYFKKLSGYDTLRLVLAKKVILVEGPSDELIVQKAYRDLHDKRPIEDGIDVINVRGLSFKRFLDIAALLGRPTTVVTDNDGDYAAVAKKYADYADDANIKICCSNDEKLKTLEPQLVAAMGLTVMNQVLGRSDATVAAMVEHMTASGNKTDSALLIHDTPEVLVMPQYIREAINV